MNNPIQETRWSENVILVDADYVDKVAFNLIVNFERMLGRRIPQADIARWIDCVALDGGIREGEHETQVVLIHQKGKQGLENFAPSAYEELDGKAFKDHLGEFAINAYPIEPIAGEDFFTEVLELVTAQKEDALRHAAPPPWRQLPAGDPGVLAHGCIGDSFGRNKILKICQEY